jgi:hypothetical protein
LDEGRRGAAPLLHVAELNTADGCDLHGTSRMYCGYAQL